ncbi:MAG: molybdopterin molybdotransferase [Acidobacteriota bacterium]|jgi:molybdopterin molybdotransferase|nr:molybdopterin molybdotransferase [Acidobacteriota bacterium]
MTTFQTPRGEAMLEVEDAQARVLAEVRVLQPESVRFDKAVGRVLREDVFALDDAPIADNSAMDGYAVRAEDIASAPVRLRVIGDVPAGRVAQERVERGTAMRIMTGANVPDGADAVVQVELTDAGSEVVEIRSAVARGANIRKRGEDVRAGALLLAAGTPLGAAEITLLAGIQKTTVQVGRRPTVAILSTGDELVDVDEPRRPGTIVNSNSYALAALVTAAGATPVTYGIVRDTREATIEAFSRAAEECDFILSSGGVSVGAFDFVKDALDALGAEAKFWRVAMKPGKPVVLSRLRDRVCLGLPGNPVSSMVSFHLFVRPALRKALGQTDGLFPPVVRVRLTAPLRSVGDRRVYARARVTAVDGELVAQPVTSQSSGALTSMVGANALVMIDRGVTGVEAGMVLPALLIDRIA